MAPLSDSPLTLPLRNANYGVYAAGNAVSLIGTWMQRITVGWLTWELTHSGLWLGIVAFADFFPVMVIGPIAGAVADRWDRLRLVQTSQMIALLQAVLLFVLTVSGHISIGILVGLTAFQGIVVAFNQPARLALVPSLVAPSDLASAVAINSVIFNLARFIGPMLAGFAIVWSGVASAFAANAVSYVAFLLALARVEVAPMPVDHGKARHFIRDLRDGIHYTATHPGMATLLVLLAAIGIGVRPLNELLPGIAADLFHSGAAGLSILASAIGGGAILGGLWLGHRAQLAGLTTIALSCSLVGAITAIVVVASESMWIAIPAIVVFGFCISSAGTAIQTLIQLASDGRMRGRVMGLYGLIFRGAPAIGALAAGTVSAYLGLRLSVFLGAVFLMAFWIWAYYFRTRISEVIESRQCDASE
jgi:MFS family permease